MGKITIHVLDTMSGCPANGVSLLLYSRSGHAVEQLLKSDVTNFDGRLNEPLLSGEDVVAGRFRLVFKIADYFNSANVALPDIPFFEDIVIDFGIADPSTHYHVPLLVSPYGYSTYRGS